jgi:Ni,Fe-hydrogenase III small subunit
MGERRKVASIAGHPSGCDECHRLDHRTVELGHRATKAGVLKEQADVVATVAIVVAALVSLVGGHPSYVWALSGLLAVLRGSSVVAAINKSH